MSGKGDIDIDITGFILLAFLMLPALASQQLSPFLTPTLGK